MTTTPKSWATREQAQQWVAELRGTFEIDQSDPEKRIEDWPLHKISAYVYQDVGPEVLKVLLEEYTFRPDQLLDNAAELDRRRLPEVAAVLREMAELTSTNGD
jgi:hypothetical protein